MCPVTGPVVLSKFQPSSGQSTIALSTTVKPEDADSDVTLCAGWVLEKNDEAMYALSFGGQYIVNCDKKLQICQDAKHTECFIWKFIDADKSHVVYCIPEKGGTTKMAWVADSKKAQISLKELDSANEAKPATEFKFVFRSLEDTKPSDSRGN